MKEKWVFACQQCGQQYSKWMGRCQECGAWNSVVEEKSYKAGSASTKKESIEPKSVSEINTENIPRLLTDIQEFDRVLGGGLVPGSVVLIGGEPGVGKSTLLLQVADQFARHQKRVLYVTGEESLSQVALRAERLKVQEKGILIVSETVVENALEAIEKIKPHVLILDSIQTAMSRELDSPSGSVGQLRQCAFQIIEVAKKNHMGTFLVGHVTKEGAIAGPKILEHMVDVVLYFEGTSSHSFRILRSMKNRFGSTSELGVFQMTSDGMQAVNNPSELFLSERPDKSPGSVITAAIEGTRPILVEIQALVSQTHLAMPRRTALGIDQNRVSLLVAILEKRGGFQFFDQDVYVNVAGGLRLNEPACDLAVIAALLSSFRGTAEESNSVYVGEVGLGGEIRSISRPLERLKEAARIGLKRAFIPKKAKKEIQKELPAIEVIGIEHIRELVR